MRFKDEWSNFKEITYNILYKLWLTIIPFVAGYYYGQFGSIKFLLIGLIPLILTIEVAHKSSGFKIERFVIDDKKNRKKAKDRR